MAFKEALIRMREKSNQRKELLKNAKLKDNVQTTVQERKKSANERELELFQKENREVQIKEELMKQRKIREDEINFGHNPLNAENIMAKKGHEILKADNIMSKGSNILNTPSIFMNKGGMI